MNNDPIETLTKPSGAACPSIFDEVVDRRRSNSMKSVHAHALLSADEAPADPLPHREAGPDFKTPPAVRGALHEAVEHRVFGYPCGAYCVLAHEAVRELTTRDRNAARLAKGILEWNLAELPVAV
ncbi:hypothetical protein [Streptosporangium sp. NPDC003464]